MMATVLRRYLFISLVSRMARRIQLVIVLTLTFFHTPDCFPVQQEKGICFKRNPIERNVEKSLNVHFGRVGQTIKKGNGITEVGNLRGRRS